MKTMKVFFLTIVFTSINLIAQHTLQNIHLNQQQLHQQISFNVTNTAQTSTNRTTTINTFQLGPGELKAGATLGNQVTRIDTSDVPRIIDNLIRYKVYKLPEIYFAREEGTNNQISYQIIYVDSAPLRFDFNHNVFNGGIRFLAVETNYLTETQHTEKKLAVPEKIYVSYREVSIPLTINQINYPPLDVTITYPNPLDSLGLKIITISRPQGYPTYLPVEPAIVLNSNRESIQGFGLQSIPISVNLKGVSSYQPVNVSLISSLGTIDSSKLKLTNNEAAQVRLRSEGIGEIKLKVADNYYSSNILAINAVFPILFLLLSILGGIIGGIGIVLKGKNKITFRKIIYSGIIGLLAAVVYWGLGIKLIELAFEDRGYNEAMVFGLGLIAGYYGIKGISKLQPEDQ